MASTVGQLFVELKNDSDAYKRDLVKTTTDAGKQGGEAASRSMAQSLGDGIRRHSKMIAAGAGAALGTFVASSAQTFSQFEQGMNEVFTLLPGISEQAMGEMEGQVKDFAIEFGRLPEEVIPALYQSLSAGVPQDNVFAFMETANKLATAGVASTSDAVGVLASITKGYGDTSEEATRAVSDMLFQTVKLGTTTLPELAASMGKAVPQAAALAVAQEELFATTAALTGVTGNTAEVSTQLKAIFTSLLKPTAEMKAGLAEMGYESGEAAVESLGLQGTLIGLQETTGGNTETFAKMLGSSEALTAGLAITGERAEAVADNLIQMGEAAESGGAVTEAAYKQMDQGVGAAARRIAARMQVLMIDVGGAIAPIAPLLAAFGPTIGRALGGAFGAGFGLLVEAIPRLMRPVIAKIIAVTGAAKMGGALTSMLGTGMAAASGGMDKLGGLMGGRFGMAFKFAGIAAVALLWVEVWNQWNAFNQKVEAAQADLQTKVDSAVQQSGSEALGNLRNLTTYLNEAQGLTRILGDTWGGAQSMEGLRNLAQAIADGTDLTAAEIEEAGVVLADASAEALARGNTAIAAEIDALAETVRSKAPAVTEMTDYIMRNGVADGAEAATDDAENAGEEVADAMVDGVAEGLGAGLPDAINEGIDALRSGATLADAFGALGTDAVSALDDALRGGVDVESAFAGLPAEVRAALEPLLPVISNAMREGNRAARHEAALMGPSIRDGIKSGRDAVDAAMADLRWAMTHPLKNVKYVAALEGKLTGKRLRDGLKSTNPDVRAAAERTRAVIIDEWEKATGQSWNHGQSVTQNLAGGIKARRKAAQGAAQTVKSDVKTELDRAPSAAQTAGGNTTKSFAEGLRSFIGRVVAAAQAIAAAVAANTKPGSPTEEGPLSKAGGMEGWGESLARQFGEGLGQAKFDPVEALGLSAFDPVGAARSGAAAAPAIRDVPRGGDTNLNLQTYGLPIRSRTPLEVAQQVRRAARLGVLAVDRPARYAEVK